MRRGEVALGKPKGWHGFAGAKCRSICSYIASPSPDGLTPFGAILRTGYSVLPSTRRCERGPTTLFAKITSLSLLSQARLKHFVYPPARGGKDTGDRLFTANRFVFEDHPVRADAESMESLQFLGERLDVTLLLGKSLDSAAQGVTGLGRKLSQILHHLGGDADGDHRASRAETGW